MKIRVDKKEIGEIQKISEKSYLSDFYLELNIPSMSRIDFFKQCLLDSSYANWEYCLNYWKSSVD